WIKTALCGGVLYGVLSGLCAPALANTTAPDQAPRPVGPTIRMALLLPLDSAALGRAADAVRDGFMAAYERDKDGVVVTLIETDDSVQQTLSGYKDAVGNQDLVVGPLSRAGVSAIAQSGAVRIPTIALNQVEAQAEAPAGADATAPAALPSNLLMMGLSLDDEA